MLKTLYHRLKLRSLRARIAECTEQREQHTQCYNELMLAVITFTTAAEEMPNEKTQAELLELVKELIELVRFKCKQIGDLNVTIGILEDTLNGSA